MPGVDKLTFNQPGVLTGGVAVRALDMLLIAADVEWIDWPSTNGSNPLPPQGTPGYPGPYGQGIQSYTTSMSQSGLDAGIAYKF